MNEAVERLIAYYRSDEFIEDHKRLEQRDPLAATQQRHTIIGQLNKNLSQLGVELSSAELGIQKRFISGDLPLPEMLKQIEQYASSISLRWSDDSLS